MRTTVQGALREVRRLAGLLKDFRSVALAQSLNLELTDLEKLVRETLRRENVAYRSVGIRVKFDIENSLPAVALDAAKMQQAVLNLCNNAVEAMTSGGCLTIKAHQSRRRWLWRLPMTVTGLRRAWMFLNYLELRKPGVAAWDFPLRSRLSQLITARSAIRVARVTAPRSRFICPLQLLFK